MLVNRWDRSSPKGLQECRRAFFPGALLFETRNWDRQGQFGDKDTDRIRDPDREKCAWTLEEKKSIYFVRKHLNRHSLVLSPCEGGGNWSSPDRVGWE